MSTRFGRYEVICKLGEGAMAAVHLARDPVLTRFVAIKVLHGTVAVGPVALQRFFNEAKTVANVRNPHIIEVFDFGKEGKDYFLVMEFVDGQSLHGILRQLRPAWPGERLADDLTAALMVQAAEGLDIAARHGVVHRDIKPENILINTQGYLKIGDFGIAHLQDESLTRTGAVLGSPLYMSPEQVRGAKPITSQSDIFSLGAVLYRCLTGSPPFASKALKDLYQKIAREPHIPIQDVRPDLDPAMAGLVETMLQKDPARRGGGPRWLRAELRAYLMAQGISDPMERVSQHLRELAQRKVETTWRIDPGAGLGADSDSASGPTSIATSDAMGLPRTVASSSPLEEADTEAGTWAMGRNGVDNRIPTLRRTAGPGKLEAISSHHGRQAPRRSSFGSKALTALVALGVASVAGFLVWSNGRIAASPKEHPFSRERPGQTLKEGGAIGAEHSASGAGTSSAGMQSSQGAAEAGLQRPAEGGTQATAGWSPPDPVPEETSIQGTASLLVQSSPPFAEVFLDGRAMGVTPVRLEGVEAGLHRLVVKGRSQTSLDTLMQVIPGHRTLRVRLDPGEVAFNEDGE